MTPETKVYRRTDKNQAKIDVMAKALAEKINGWLDGKPTGQIILSFEVHANQGGLGDIFVECKDRGRL